MPYADPHSPTAIASRKAAQRRWQRIHPEYRHARNRARWQAHTARLAAIKLAAGCADCGYAEHPHALDFDHRDPSTKSFGIGGAWSKSLARVAAEIAKCDVVCANCHRIRTAYRRAA